MAWKGKYWLILYYKGLSLFAQDTTPATVTDHWLLMGTLMSSKLSHIPPTYTHHTQVFYWINIQRTQGGSGSLVECTCADPEGGTGCPAPPPPPLKNHFIEFPSNPENHKTTKPAFNVDHYRPTSETPFQWHFAGRPIIARFRCFLEPRSPQKTNAKKLIRVGPPLTKLSGSAHGA